jgi:hypothetical protein
MGWWTDLRDSVETGAVLAGNYFLPGSSLITSKLVSDNAKQQLNSDLGVLAQLGTAGAGAWNGNLANYKTAANSILGSVSPGTTVESLSQATGLTGAQLAKLGITAASLLAGGSAVANAAGGGGAGGLGLTQQDRSGFSSGSANYSPEYYAAIQSKYNKYMPQARGENITNDLKNWYETKYTPGSATATTATVAGVPTGATTGTGYTTATTLANLGMKPQAMLPSYTDLNANLSTAKDVASEYAKFIAASGGNTQANRQAAIDYLQQKGFSGDQINAAYDQYLSTLPKATGTTAETMAANSTPAQIAQAYASYVNANGGDTIFNRQAAIDYLVKIGVPVRDIEAAYPIYKASLAATPATAVANTTTGGGMLTGGGQTDPTAALLAKVQANAAEAPPAYSIQAGATPLYTTLSAASNPQAIADAYKQYVGTGGETKAKQEEALAYLTNLGVNQNTINQAYGLFKGV